MKKNILLTLIFAAGLFTCKSALSTFSNSGSMYGSDLNISADCYENNGKMNASNSVTINATTLKGSGSIIGVITNVMCDNYHLSGSISGTQKCIIKAKSFEESGTIDGSRVSIICDEFKFNGTISAQECVIYTKHLFDYNMFKRVPEGKYTVIITKNDVQLFTHDNLRSLAISTFVDSCLSLVEQNIENEVIKIRNWAALNRIDDTKIFIELKKALEEKISYYQERLDQKRGDLFNLFAGILSGVAGLSFATAATMNRKFIREKLEMGAFEYGLVATVISAVPILLSPILIGSWLNPQYKERYEKLSLITSKIDQALLIPRIPEEEIIVLQ